MNKRLIFSLTGFIAAALTSVALIGCPQSGQVVLPGSGSVPLGRLYVSNVFFTGPSPSPSPPLTVSVFQGPFSTGTLLSGTISSGLIRPFGVAVDPTDTSGKVFVSDAGPGVVEVYARPNPNGGAPLFALALPTASPLPAIIGFDANGNLYVPNDAASGKVYAFSHTVGSGSTGSPLSLSSLGTPVCAAVDSSGNLYVVDQSFPYALRMYGPSHSGAPVASTTIGVTGVALGCAVDPLNQDAYVVNADNGLTVVGYASPLTAGASPIVTITWPVSMAADGITFDSSGNLYVAVATGATRTESIAVFSASSLSGNAVLPSAAAFSFPGGQYISLQLAFGP